MAHEFKMKRRVEFAETDMAGILHFSNYFRFMEATEHAFFRSLGLCVHAHDPDGVWGWARGQAECSYRAPLCYEDIVEIQLLVREKKSRSIRYEFVFRKDGDEVARGALTAVCVARREAQHENRPAIQAIEMPDEVDALIAVAPA